MHPVQLIASISPLMPTRTGPQLKWLLVLPPEYHAHLVNHGGIIADHLHGPTHDKQATTLVSMKVHYTYSGAEPLA